jgi:hypothetical protein
MKDRVSQRACHAPRSAKTPQRGGRTSEYISTKPSTDDVAQTCSAVGHTPPAVVYSVPVFAFTKAMMAPWPIRRATDILLCAIPILLQINREDVE